MLEFVNRQPFPICSNLPVHEYIEYMTFCLSNCSYMYVFSEH